MCSCDCVMGADKMIPRQVYNKPFTLRFPHRDDWRGRFQPDKWEISMVHRCFQDKWRHWSWGIWLLHEEEASLQLWTVHMGIQVYATHTCAVGNMGRDHENTSIFHQTVKHQLNHLTITRSILKWSGFAINPSWNWINVTEFNRYGWQDTGALMAVKLPISL